MSISGVHTKRGILLMVDHIDGNGLNNQKNNLRLVTPRQNNQNKVHYAGASKYPGVRRAKSRKRWRAEVRIGGRLKHLGCFNTEGKAFTAYKEAVESMGEGVLGWE